MLLIFSLFSIWSVVVSDNECYWNRQCKYQLFATATPYDTIRGDLRDYPSLDSCEAVSVWTLHRHGNRHPGDSVITDINELRIKLKEEIIKSVVENRNSLCSQDVEDILKWEWNSTVEAAPSYLTQVGYEEIYSIGKRTAKKYRELLNGVSDRYYFRATDEERTRTSAKAFVEGLTDGMEIDLTSRIDDSWEKDNIIRPYEHCDRYQELVKNGPKLTEQLAAYDQSLEYLAVRERVLKRLGVSNHTALNIFSLYELCRFYRTWSPNLQCPWCSLFTDEDLAVLEYRDDVRHYYKNGYGSEINANLGGLPLRDLYESFEAAIDGDGKNIISYFTHDTMMEMVFSALGLYKDRNIIEGSTRTSSRLWRTSYISSFSTNFMAVLSRCLSDTYRVQLFINEKPTSLCPVEGCLWEEFVETFQRFANSTLSFCTKTQSDKEKESNSSNNSVQSKYLFSLIILLPLLLLIE